VDLCWSVADERQPEHSARGLVRHEVGGADAVERCSDEHVVSFTRVEMVERPGPDQDAGADPFEDPAVDITFERPALGIRKAGRADEFDVVRSAHAPQAAGSESERGPYRDDLWTVERNRPVWRNEGAPFACTLRRCTC